MHAFDTLSISTDVPLPIHIDDSPYLLTQVFIYTQILSVLCYKERLFNTKNVFSSLFDAIESNSGTINRFVA